MSFFAFLKHMVSNFTQKQRISITNPHTSEKIWHMYISPLNVLISFLAFILVITGAVTLIIAYTPIMDMIPGYPGNKSRHILIENILRLDSLENEIQLWSKYRENMTAIMDGKTPVSNTVSSDASGTSGVKRDISIVQPSKVDSIFRNNFQDRKNMFNDILESNKQQLSMFIPVSGGIVKNIENNNQAYIQISVPERSSVVAASDGSVVLSQWTPENGHIIVLQHGGNLLSMYKSLSETTVNIGDRIKGGDVLGYIGKDNVGGTILFEIWENGHMIDPKKYMVF